MASIKTDNRIIPGLDYLIISFKRNQLPFVARFDNIALEIQGESGALSQTLSGIIGELICELWLVFESTRRFRVRLSKE